MGRSVNENAKDFRKKAALSASVNAILAPTESYLVKDAMMRVISSDVNRERMYHLQN